jgi:hypothetical protein
MFSEKMIYSISFFLKEAVLFFSVVKNRRTKQLKVTYDERENIVVQRN